MSKDVYLKETYIGKPSMVTDERVYVDTDVDGWTSAFGKCLLMGLGMKKGSGLNLTNNVSDQDYQKIQDVCSIFGVEVNRPTKVGANKSNGQGSRNLRRVGAHQRTNSNFSSNLLDEDNDQGSMSQSFAGARRTANRRVGSTNAEFANEVINGDEEDQDQESMSQSFAGARRTGANSSKNSQGGNRSSRGFTHGLDQLEDEKYTRNLTVCELREIAKDLGIKYSGLRKDDLLMKIEEAKGKQLI